MSEGNSPTFKVYWERYCPCRLHKKNVVLIIITICCFALVFWTLMATMKGPEKPPVSNITYVIIDDSKELHLLNFTTSSLLIKAKEARSPSSPTQKPKKRMSFLKELLHPVTKETLCKCLCVKLTNEEILAAMQFKVDNSPVAAEEGVLIGSTVATPPGSGSAGEWGNDTESTFVPPTAKSKKTIMEEP